MDHDKEYPIDPIRITDVLDLHGFFPEQVPEVLEAFLDNAIELHLKEIKIIHGKGKSRLKFEVYRYLDSHSKVLTYRDALPHQGGWGATLVELKSESEEE